MGLVRSARTTWATTARGLAAVMAQNRADPQFQGTFCGLGLGSLLIALICALLALVGLAFVALGWLAAIAVSVPAFLCVGHSIHQSFRHLHTTGVAHLSAHERMAMEAERNRA